MAFGASCAVTSGMLHVAGAVPYAVPDSRSSHVRPTPTAGGVGIVVGVAAGALMASLLDMVVLAAALLLAVVGLIDDVRPLSARLRLAVHVAVCAVPLWWPQALPSAPWLLLCGVWWINLFNFMDGIDGLAGMQAVFIAVVAACLGSGGALFWVIAASAAGFLLYNRPPAKIFMGDVGSTFLAFVLFVAGMQQLRTHALPFCTWPLLGAVFIVDATVTLLQRRRRGLHGAHRTHVYQRLARRWGSHRSVTLAYAGVNLLWVLPWTLAAVHSQVTPWVAMGAVYLPLVVAALVLKAGEES